MRKIVVKEPVGRIEETRWRRKAVDRVRRPGGMEAVGGASGTQLPEPPQATESVRVDDRR